MTCKGGRGSSVPACECTCPRACSPSRSGRGGIGKGSGLGALAVVISGVGQGKESSEEVASSGRGWSVVYGVCAALSDKLVGIRVWG